MLLSSISTSAKSVCSLEFNVKLLGSKIVYLLVAHQPYPYMCTFLHYHPAAVATVVWNKRDAGAGLSASLVVEP